MKVEGLCSESQLVNFSQQVMGLRFFGGIPKDDLVLSLAATKKRRNSHQAINDNGEDIRRSVGKLLNVSGVNMVFIDPRAISKVKWVSGRGNRVDASRFGADQFNISLTEITPSLYREMLEQCGIKLNPR